MTLEQAKAKSKNIALKSREACYIADCAIYARSDDSFTKGPYIVGTKTTFDILYGCLAQFGGNVIGMIDSSDFQFKINANPVR